MPGTDSKLFVGMISKTADDASTRAMFSPFGPIVEVFIMKDKNTNREKASLSPRAPRALHPGCCEAAFDRCPPRSENKGCAFVKFAHRQDALKAIDALNGKVTMSDQASPLVVKFADPPKGKDEHAMSKDLMVAQVCPFLDWDLAEEYLLNPSS